MMMKKQIVKFIQLSMKNIKDNDENIAPTLKNFEYENFD